MNFFTLKKLMGKISLKINYVLYLNLVKKPHKSLKTDDLQTFFNRIPVYNFMVLSSESQTIIFPFGEKNTLSDDYSIWRKDLNRYSFNECLYKDLKEYLIIMENIGFIY